MLTRLQITNYALINELSVDFLPGLNSVTGETGAGKSIILGALGLILGNRADMSVLKNNDEKCVVEGYFDIGSYNLIPFFTENELDYDNHTILRREITPAGKSRAFINDTPVNLKTLQELALCLIDIHSQHQNLELSNQKFQLNLVDTTAGAELLLSAYKSVYSEYKKWLAEIEILNEKSEKASADLDYFQFQFKQLDEARLSVGELESLEAEQKRLTHTEEIKTALLKINQLLDDEQVSTLQNIKEAHKTALGIAPFIHEGTELAERINSVFQEVKDIVAETNDLAEKTDHDPDRIEIVAERINLLYSLLQKHHVSTDSELIALRDEFERKISEITGYSDEIERCKKEIATTRTHLEKASADLTACRKSVFQEIEKSVTGDLIQLGIPKARFSVVHRLTSDFGLTGRDNISFLFSANADIPPEEISEIASGGEMSRLMLAIKNLMRNSKSMPTVVFDEIDSGVSGEVAVKMGNILKSFSKNTQIINITHLPQIAAKGDHHFLVFKSEKEGKTFTSIRKLNVNERIEELAKMVGGEKMTEATLNAAKEMLS